VNTTITKCENCGEEFESRVVHNKAWQRFCSRSCKGKSQPPTQKCYDLAHTPEINEKIKQRMTGEANPMWQGGDSDKERRNSEYKNWRIDVFRRDCFKCQSCGYQNGDDVVRRDLNAHHIVAWIDSIELRYEIENGITLCVPCHIKQHKKKN